MSHAVAMMMLNGRLDDDVIVPYLDALPSSGYGGVCLHPRDGLAVPYGSDQFWRAIERIVGHARDRGLDVWFYDEFSFPSGADGGRIVARHPGARARQLSFRRIDPEVDALGNIELGAGDLLALLRIRGDDVQDVTGRCGTHRNHWVAAEMFETDYLCTINVRQVPHERAVSTATVFVYQPETPLRPDEELLAVSVVPVPARHGEAGLPDVALPEVTDRFLDEVYARYGRYARDLGTAAVPIFQDEVAYQCDHPWNELIEQELRDLWGPGWRCRLRELYEPVGAGWEIARYEYWRVCGGLLERNWFGRVAAYCRANGLRMTGHLPGEESFLGHWRLLGDAFRTLSHFDLPGYDVINPPTVDDVHRSQAKGIKLVQSARWLTGRGPMIAEVFGATGFQHDAQQARTILAWLGLHDILQPIDHSTWTSAASLRKYDAPPVNTRFNPLEVGRADLFEWHEWFGGLMRDYSFDPEVLVLLPQESLARYRLEERDRWAGEVSLLETFFHYLEAASVDVVMIPSEQLADLEAGPRGLTLAGHTFSRLVVPPVASLHEATYAELERLAPTGTLLWTIPGNANETPVFGTEAVVRPLPLKGVPCTEDDLVRDRADWFHSRLSLRTELATTTRTVIKSVRRAPDGSRLLVLINPHEDALPVDFPTHPGALRAQPLTGDLSLVPTDNTWQLTLPPRAVAAIGLQPVQKTKEPSLRSGLGEESAELSSGTSLRAAGGLASAGQPARSAVRGRVVARTGSYRVLGDNCLRLERGTVELAGYGRREFEPGPVSLLWAIDGVYRDEGVLNLPAHSAAPMEAHLVADFVVEVEEQLDELRVVLDDESAPYGARVSWDGVELAPRRAAVFDPDNTTYVLPMDGLAPGTHVLRVAGSVRRGDDGLSEAPILVGRFRVDDGRLGRLPDGPEAWETGTPWRDLGMPHGFGPVEYRFRFDVPADAAGPGRIVLPDCVGVADVALDGEPAGRRSWEPRDIAVDHLGAGEHDVRVVLYGSWNNVFSRLNTVTNGLLGPVGLVFSAAR